MPVTVTAYVPAVEELIVKVELSPAPGVRVMLAWDGEAVAPPPETEAASVRVPEKPKLFRLTGRVPEEPAGRLTEVTRELTVKSFSIVKVTVTVWTIEPLVPMTVRLYWPPGVAVVVEIIRTEEPVAPWVRATLAGFNDPARAVVDGGEEDDRAVIVHAETGCISQQQPCWPSQ